MQPIPDDRALAALAGRVGRALADRGWTVSTAESCTGGWIAKCLTDVPGSSAWFHYSLVCYSNPMKSRLLGVAAETLAAQGAVSEAAVASMAGGAIAAGDSQLSVAVSGIAGPDGGTTEKPVGLVWIAWAQRGGAVSASPFRFEGDREAVRRQAVAAALEGVLNFCEN